MPKIEKIDTNNWPTTYTSYNILNLIQKLSSLLLPRSNFLCHVTQMNAISNLERNWYAACSISQVVICYFKDSNELKFKMTKMI